MTDDGLTIGELAEAAGVSPHTVRYYDDSGLIPGVERTAAGHRRFLPDHVRWMGLLKRLRTSGMSVERVRRYACLAAAGDATTAERRALLARHAAEMRRRIEDLQASLRIVEAKIDLYDGTLTDRSVIWRLVDEARRRTDGADG